jgi:hypothetical protein
MFDSPFNYEKINHQKKEIGDAFYIEHVYSFRNKQNKRYLVFIEQYDYNVHVVKFCLHERKNYTDRFNILSKRFECSRVLATIGVIMRELVKINPYASFGFIGSPLPNEELRNTKRFRLYSLVVEQLISPVIFEHRKSILNSGYLMLNRDNNEKNLLIKVEDMFNEFYLFNA